MRGINSTVRAFYLESELLSGKKMEDIMQEDTGRGFIQPLIKRQTLFQNARTGSEFEITCIDGFFTDVGAIKIVAIPQNAKHIVLASDGYPELYPTLEQTEEALAEILKDDPMLFREYKSTKGLEKGNISYDDRSYVKFVLSG